MRILDLFSGAGGAAVGYHRAFPDAEIVGVDINPQPRYPFTFEQRDVMELRDFHFRQFDLIHASPPCQDHSTVTGKDRKVAGEKGTGWMLHAIVDRLRRSGVTWVVENVEGAEMPVTVFSFTLCGSSFGLDVRRHRKFATGTLMFPPSCAHAWQTPRFVPLDNAGRKAGRLASVVGVHGHTQYAGEQEIRQRAMGIDWMSPYELTQAIPPAYCEWIGNQLKVAA